MCGIAGFTESLNKNIEREEIEDFVNTIKHRGLDGGGIFLDNGNKNSKVALGHRRLSIIDLSENGAQPMTTSDANLTIVFNGEIYNFQELKKELEQFNIKYSGHSDTEVILNYYKYFSEKVFEKMNGMFAIAIYDKMRNSIILARDPLGKKPLYYTIQNDNLYFSSEIKSFFEISEVKKEINLDIIPTYFANDFIPTPHTIYKNIYKLEPGTYLKYSLINYEIQKIKFWDFKIQKLEKQNIDFLKSRVENILEEAIKKRMVSDVPLGVFLSGGIDSSIVTYFAQKNSKEKINTYSISFNEKSYDESMYSKQVAEYLGTNHHNYEFTIRDVKSQIENLSFVLDEPMADSSILPTLILSKFTKEKVTVALGGDGGDEVFAGYPTFQMEQFLKLFFLLPKKCLFIVLNKILRILPNKSTNFSPKFLIQKILDGLEEENIYKRHLKWLGSFNEREISQLLKINRRNNYEFINQYNLEDKDNVMGKENGLLQMYNRTYLMDEVMVKVDRASMFYSLETRSPFLDKELVNLVYNIPYNLKLRFFTVKFLLKKICEGKLPKNIIWRKKKGFGVPLGKWFKGELKYLLDSHLVTENFPTDIFNYSYIEQIKNEHLKNRYDHRKKLWSLIVFAIWYKKFLNDLKV